MRICFFGDSLVNGTGDDDGLGWVGRVVARARQGGRDVTGYNLGIRRDTSAEVAGRWKGEANLRLPPECDGRLVFSFGANDCASNGADDGPRVGRAESLAHAEVILDTARRWLPTLMIGPGIIASDREANARVRALSADYAGVSAARDTVPWKSVSSFSVPPRGRAKHWPGTAHIRTGVATRLWPTLSRDGMGGEAGWTGRLAAKTAEKRR